MCILPVVEKKQNQHAKLVLNAAQAMVVTIAEIAGYIQDRCITRQPMLCRHG